MSSIVHEHGRGCWLSWALCWDHSIIYFVLIEMKVRVLGPTAFTLIRFMPLIAFLRESGLMKVLIAFLRENGLMTVLVAFLRESGLRRGIRFPEMWFYKIYIWYYCLAMAMSQRWDEVWFVKPRCVMRWDMCMIGSTGCIAFCIA